MSFAGGSFGSQVSRHQGRCHERDGVASGAKPSWSAIGGVCERKRREPASLSAHLTGHIRATAETIDQARSLLAGNPHFEAGETVEIRELQRTD
jgi:hypothetical protein